MTSTLTSLKKNNDKKQIKSHQNKKKIGQN